MVWIIVTVIFYLGWSLSRYDGDDMKGCLWAVFKPLVYASMVIVWIVLFATAYP